MTHSAPASTPAPGSYDEAVAWILGRQDLERSSQPRVGFRYDLALVRDLLDRLGSPHLGRATIHVAGSKGKGSTAAIAAAITQAAGLRTGLYTSPHLHDFRERVQVDRVPIPEQAVVDAVARLRPLVDQVNARHAPRTVSTFEIITALAFDWFRQQAVDVQVIEVGLGGRLDATNVVEPTVCALTSISYEHTEILGETLEEIAAEKAGILKPGIPAVAAPQAPEVLDVFRRMAQERDCRLLVGGEDLRWSRAVMGEGGQQVTITTPRGDYPVVLPLLGAHQVENAAVAIGCVEQLARAGLAITRGAITRGVAAVRWDGRLQVIGQAPRIVADGAHNADSAVRLKRALQASFRWERLHLVLGVNRDKHLADMLATFAPLQPVIIATQSRHPRAMDAREVQAVCQDAGLTARVIPDVRQALVAARETAGPEDLVCVFGSLFVVAEAIAATSPGPAAAT